MVTQNLEKDHGYAWIVLVASCGIEVIGGMLFGCVGFLTSAILEEIDNDLTKASLVSSTMLGTFTLFGPLAGAIQDKLDHRLTGIISGVLMLTGLTAASFCRTILGLVLTFGIITGVGLGLAFNLSGVAPGNYFDKKLPMAYGVCVSGAGLGLFLTGPLTVFLLEMYNISGTLLVLGGIAFHVCLAGALIRPRTQADTVEEISVSVITGSDVYSAADDRACVQGTETNIPASTESVMDSVRKWFFILEGNGFFLYAISILFCSMGESACMVHLPNYVEHKGSTAVQSGNILIGMGATSVISGILTGFAASDQTVPKILLHTGFQGLSGVLTILLPMYSYSYPLQMVFGALYGIYGQASFSLLGPICIELTGLSNLPAAYGLTFFSLGVGYLIGPPIASLLYEMSGIYDYTFAFAGCCMVASAFAAAFIPMFKQKQSANVG